MKRKDKTLVPFVYQSVVSYELEWQTVDGTAPVDRPPCGFYGELCQTENNGTYIDCQSIYI